MSLFRPLLVAALLLVAQRAESAEPEALRPGAHEAVINGVRLWWRVAGREEGAPVVFLHGGPGQGSQTFARFAGPALERTQRMVYLDQRGGGRSEKPWTKAYSLDLMVDDVEQLRVRLGAPKIAVIGHSFGTVVALEYAAKHPDRVSHLVLAGAVVDFPAAIDLQCARLERELPEVYARAVTGAAPATGPRCNPFAAPRAFIDSAMFPDPAVMKQVEETDATDGMFNTGEIFGALAGQGILQHRFDKADRLTMPVLAISGAKDFQAVVEPVRAFVAAAPRARLIEYEGRGHFMFVEDPERFAADVSAFLRSRPTRDR